MLIPEQKHFTQTSFHQILYISTRNSSNEEMTFFRLLCSRNHFSLESFKKNPQNKKNASGGTRHRNFHQILSLTGLPTFSFNVLCAGKAWAAHLEHFTHTTASLVWQEGTLTLWASNLCNASPRSALRAWCICSLLLESPRVQNPQHPQHPQYPHYPQPRESYPHPVPCT